MKLYDQFWLLENGHRPCVHSPAVLGSCQGESCNGAAPFLPAPWATMAWLTKFCPNIVDILAYFCFQNKQKVVKNVWENDTNTTFEPFAN